MDSSQAKQGLTETRGPHRVEHGVALTSIARHRHNVWLVKNFQCMAPTNQMNLLSKNSYLGKSPSWKGISVSLLIPTELPYPKKEYRTPCLHPIRIPRS